MKKTLLTYSPKTANNQYCLLLGYIISTIVISFTRACPFMKPRLAGRTNKKQMTFNLKFNLNLLCLLQTETCFKFQKMNNKANYQSKLSITDE